MAEYGPLLGTMRFPPIHRTGSKRRMSGMNWWHTDLYWGPVRHPPIRRSGVLRTRVGVPDNDLVRPVGSHSSTFAGS